MSSSNSRSNLVGIAVVAILVLLSLCGYLFYTNQNLKQSTEQLSQQVDESEKLKAELEKTYYESLSELEEMRGNNEELNALIEKQKDELKEKKNQIGRLLRNKSDLAKAKVEMQNMRTQMDEYLTQINTLKAENEQLTAKTVDLTNRNESLQSDLTSKIAQNEDLESVRATLVSEKADLTSKNAVLGKKVSIASVIKVADIEVTGWKIRKSGKTAKKKYAKNVDRLELCFNTTDNTIAEAGKEAFQIRIINPLGETLAVEEMGSGVLTNQLTDEEVRYTKSEAIDYQNEAGNICTHWEPNAPFDKGIYAVEVYNKGYLAGKGEFRLK